MRSRKVEFVLDQTLKEIKVSGNRLHLETKIRSNTIYDMLNKDKKMVKLEDLTLILDALNRIAKQDGINREFDITDILR